jgi:hypothetical protein
MEAYDLVPCLKLYKSYSYFMSGVIILWFSLMWILYNSYATSSEFF